jgi:hypothetical protein
MAIVITPRQDDAPLRGEIVQSQASFRAPASIRRTPEQEALIEETHHNGIQLLGMAWQQDLANRVNRGLMISATDNVVQAAVEVEAILNAAPALGEGTQAIIQGAVSAILQQGAAAIQQTTILGIQTIGEMGNQVPTGKEILKKREKEAEREREAEEQRRRDIQQRKPGLIEVLFGSH